MNKLVLAIVVFALCALNFVVAVKAGDTQQKTIVISAQKDSEQSWLPNPSAISDCSYTFASGAHSAFLKYCVMANGNISQLEPPIEQDGFDSLEPLSKTNLRNLR